MNNNNQCINCGLMPHQQHTPINQLILDSKDLSAFPIVRVAQGWQVTDLRDGQVRIYKTKRAAQVAICAVVKWAMQ